MIFLALKILMADRGKYLGLVFAVAFASMLTAHQLAMFVGILRRTSSVIDDVEDADAWVMDPSVKYLDENQPLPESALERVRGVEGVAWAAPFLKCTAGARGPGGEFQAVFLIGVDDESLAGAPRRFLQGELAALFEPDAVVLDDTGYGLIFPGERPTLGKTLELDDHRAVVVGICRCAPPFQTLPILYARYRLALSFAPLPRKPLSFVLVRAAPGVSVLETCARIERATGLKALPRAAFAWATHRYYLEHTGIPANFGITVTLAFVVGVVVTGQTFYLFTVENLRHFGALKAIGFTNAQLTLMVVFQAALVAVLGLSFGLGLAAFFFFATGEVPALRGFFLPWQVAVLTGGAVIAIISLASLVSLRRLYVLEPAVVFRS